MRERSSENWKKKELQKSSEKKSGRAEVSEHSDNEVWKKCKWDTWEVVKNTE